MSTFNSGDDNYEYGYVMELKERIKILEDENVFLKERLENIKNNCTIIRKLSWEKQPWLI